MYIPMRYYILEDRIKSGHASKADVEEYHRLEEELERLKQQEEEEQRLAKRYKRLCREQLTVFWEEVVIYDPLSSISSQELYAIYCQWCKKEQIAAYPIRSLCYWMKHKANRAIIPCTMVVGGKRCRGFRGLRCNIGNT